MINGRSHAAWFHDIMAQVADARRNGRGHEIPALLDTVLTVGGPHLRKIADRTLLAVASSEAGGRGIADLEEDLSPDGRPCDFCAEPDVGCYYPFEPFEMDEVLPGGLRNVMPSGDRMYVCDRCHGYVETDDWKAMRAWVGHATADNVALLWWGFRNNRTGPAVAFPPGTNPELDR